jgi:hypothetical protein
MALKISIQWSGRRESCAERDLIAASWVVALAFSRKTSWVFVVLMPSTVISAPARRAR